MWRSLVALLIVALLPWLASTLAVWTGLRGDFAQALFGVPPDDSVWAEDTPPDGWRESAYLAAYPDVAAAVRRGDFASGYAHYRTHGAAEGRTSGLPPASPTAEGATTEEAASAPAVPGPSSPAGEVTVAVTIAPAPPPQPTRPVTTPEPPGDVPPEPPVAVAPAGPEAGGARYVIRSGGTLDRVAEVTGHSAAAVRAANPGLPDTWLPGGTEVRLPAPATAPDPVPPPVPDPAAAPQAAPSRPGPPFPPPVKPSPRPAAPATATEPATSATTTAATTAATTAVAAPGGGTDAAGVAVTGLRFGIHPEATRVVLDLTGPAALAASRRADARTLEFDLPGTRWTAPPRGTLARTTPAVRYRIEPLGPTGTRLVLSADDGIRVKYSAPFPPAGTRGHRIVIDVAPDE